jgi:acyl-CoA synthetase (AMP-forming)/AMP-acid ligase II
MAAVLGSLGVHRGDRVLIYMPMIPEAAFAMLACARLGAIHSVVFGGFAAASLATRIDDAKPRSWSRPTPDARGEVDPVQGPGRRGDPARDASAGEGADRRPRPRQGDGAHGRPRRRLR